ncbi:hypothetical protein [uncultured Winogradskyella sp.]|uniref:hypothetical protein n=1 Tax=Winogradskyella sp. 4-2091 TaxID=3381659 RepID=UPI00260DF94A|nr:hypothetical protein [uncultured Winogradskyella sp.]
MKFKLDDFKICEITEISQVVGGASDCKTASHASASNGGCDDDWSWDDRSSNELAMA